MCVARNGASNDSCDKSRHGYVLGNIPLEPDGDNGEALCIKEVFSKCGTALSIGLILFIPCLFLQEAYSVARQFNQIPPICEQAEYHMFQREKVEVQLPELFHKIGEP